MKIAMEQAQTYPTFPKDSLIQVSVADITERVVEGRDGKSDWKSLSFRFNILGMPDYLEKDYASLIGDSIYGSVGGRLTSHPDNKLRQWTEALLDLGELGDEFELDTEMLIGRKARAQIDTYFKRDSTVEKHKVANLLPFNPTNISREPAMSGFGSDEPPF